MNGQLDPRQLTGRRRFAAYVALGALAVLALNVLVVGFGVGSGRGLLGALIGVVVRMGVFVAAAWWAITTTTRWKRTLAMGVAAVAAVSILVDVIVVTFDNLGALLLAALSLVVFAVATRTALGTGAGAVGERQEPAALPQRAAALVPALTRPRGRFDRPVLLVNPGSGAGGAEGKRRQHGLARAAWRRGVQVRYLPPGFDLRTFAHQAVADGADALGVAGGDGSVSTVAAVAIQYKLPFVVVPAGTRNHFARDLGLDRATPAAALEAFASGTERRIDVGTVGDRLFLNNVSVGVYATLVHTPGYRDDRLAAINSLLPGVLRGEHAPVKLRFTGPDGRVWDQALVLLISNNVYPLTSFGARPRLDAGTLEISALQPTDGAGYAKALGLAASQPTASGEHWARWSCTTFRLDSPEGRLAVGIDGEAVELATPLAFKVLPAALRVLVPPSSPDAGGHLVRANRLLNPAVLRKLLDAAAGRDDSGRRRDA